MPESPYLVHVRPAAVEDAAEACGIIRDSITQLCRLDHGSDAQYLEKWLSSKTTENVRRWIEQAHRFVAEGGGKIVGVAAMRSDGKVTLNYVAPAARFQGISKALMARIEAAAKSVGIKICTLESTRTALPFYESLGFVRSPETYVSPLTGTMAQVLMKRLD
jgi:GNAT superfamily N-acetyltransferase